MTNIKLTPLARILIVAAIAIGLFFLIKGCFTEPDVIISGNDDDIEIVDAGEKENLIDRVTEPNQSNVKMDFNYTPPAPQNGQLKGVVELGAAGFNSFIVNIDKQKNWKLLKADWGNSLVYENMATVRDIRDGLKAYIGDMADYGVNGRDIHFVVSSGAQKVAETVKIIDELKELNYFVNTVTPEEEARYALQASLPEQFKNNSFMVDIGSGNTKISYEKNGKVIAFETYGAKYYKNNAEPKTVYREARETVNKIPSDKTKTCFILGGVPFKLAQKGRKAEERYTVLEAPAAYTDEEGSKIEAGLNIYKAIKDGTGCDTFVFDWEGNFTIGFLLTL